MNCYGPRLLYRLETSNAAQGFSLRGIHVAALTTTATQMAYACYSALVLSHLLAFVLIIALPVWDHFETRRLKAARNPRVKIQSYQLTIAWLWICAVIAIVMFGSKPLWTIHVSALQAPWLPPESDRRAVGLALGIGFLVSAFIPVLLVRTSPKLRDAYEKQFARLSFFLPKTEEERLWFAVVCVSAGICEELLFRGFLIRYFQAEIPMTYSFMRRSAEKNSPKSVRKLGEDPGEDSSEGVAGHIQFRLNLPFLFPSGAQSRPLFSNANRFREFGYRSLRAQSPLAGSNSRGSTT